MPLTRKMLKTLLKLHFMTMKFNQAEIRNIIKYTILAKHIMNLVALDLSLFQIPWVSATNETRPDGARSRVNKTNMCQRF